MSIRGQRVRVGMNGTSYDGRVIFGSDNRKSLMLAFDGALRTSTGGMYVGQLPVMTDDEGIYRDLVAGDEVEIEWLDEPEGKA